MESINSLRRALEFYDKVRTSDDQEQRTAVGQDHVDGVLAAARRVVEMDDKYPEVSVRTEQGWKLSVMAFPWRTKDEEHERPAGLTEGTLRLRFMVHLPGKLPCYSEVDIDAGELTGHALATAGAALHDVIRREVTTEAPV